MKKLLPLFLIAGTLVASTASAQGLAGASLDINNIKAKFNAEGSLFNDFNSMYDKGFEVPKGSGKHTLFAGGLWIGGFDAGGSLKIAAQTYRQLGVDYWPGPLSGMATTDSPTIAQFSRAWKIRRCDIDAYSLWISAGMPGGNPVDSTAMEAINSWPATNPFGGSLAPFTDVNSNGIYEPMLGDVPDIKGDQAVFFVFNDNGGAHTETGAPAIGLEIQGMAYAYSCINDSALYNTVFTNYKIINKGSFQLDSAFIGNWMDVDLGNAIDDYIGSDVTRSAYYAYNGSSVDSDYGPNPPAQGVVFLQGAHADSNFIDDASLSTVNGTGYGDGIVDNEFLGMTRFLNYKNDFSVTGNPVGGTNYYQYLSGYWKDATPWTYGGTGHLTGVQTDYLYPGSSDPLGYGTNGIPQPAWDESSAGNSPGDRRGIGATGPFTLLPGATHEIEFAYVYARATSGGPAASVTLLKERIDSIRMKYQNPNLHCGCASLTGISETEIESQLLLYPNPVADQLSIEYTSASGNYTIRIYDALGKLVINTTGKSGLQVISTEELIPGLYLLNIHDNGHSVTKRFIRQ